MYSTSKKSIIELVKCEHFLYFSGRQKHEETLGCGSRVRNGRETRVVDALPSACPLRAEKARQNSKPGAPPASLPATPPRWPNGRHMRRLGPIASPVTDHPALAALVSASPTMEQYTTGAISRESPRLTTTPVTGPGSHFPGLLTPSPSSPPVTLRPPPLRPILASPFLMAFLPVSAQQVSLSPTPPLQAVVRL